MRTCIKSYFLQYYIMFPTSSSLYYLIINFWLTILSSQLSTLPSKISYSTVHITTRNGSKIDIPRRELFDIRAQLMAEDSEDDHDLLSGLGKDDIKTNVYEGGFKTWECSMDLAKLISDDPGIDNGTTDRRVHCIEVHTLRPKYTRKSCVQTS